MKCPIVLKAEVQEVVTALNLPADTTAEELGLVAKVVTVKLKTCYNCGFKFKPAEPDVLVCNPCVRGER